jgi:hypothetical protein
MRIVYIILAHKLPEQMVRLVRKLNTDGTSFLIHIDKKTDNETFNRMVAPLSEYENISFLPRHRRYYGDYNIVRATLEGIQNLLVLDKQFDYVMLLSGQDYPIKSNSQIDQVLKESDGQSYMEFFSLPSEKWEDEDGGLNRIRYWHFRLFGREVAFLRKGRYFKFIPDSVWSALVKIFPIQRSLPGDFKPYGGSAWWCLTRDCIDYVGEFVEKNPEFVKFFKHVKIPDEIFFQTILMNSPFKDQITYDNLRYITWPPGSRHPTTLDKRDFKNFMSSNKLFARKFDTTIDADVLDMIDREIS